MVVTNKALQRILCALAFFVGYINQSFAQMMAKGKTKVKSVLNLYHQNSDDGKQVFDNSGREEVNVAEPMIFMEHQITEDTVLSAHFVADFWTAASDTKLDAGTGASGEGRKGQSRFSGSVGFQSEKGKWNYGSNFGFSSEYDYKSLNGSFNVSRSFAKDNFTLGFGLQYYKDEVSLFESLSPAPTASISPGRERTIVATSVSASQILTRRDIALFTLNYIRSTGRLESTASSVIAGGLRDVERLPGQRNRYAASAQWVHALNAKHVLNSTYRYYWDNWDLSAHSLKVSYLWEVNDNEDYIELYGRYHNQSAVKYYAASFTAGSQLRTSDSDLSDFSSYEVGTMYKRLLSDGEPMTFLGVDFENVSWTNGVTYSMRDQGMKYGYFQTALSFEF